ncbi:MAG: hypothetical protein ACOZF0_00330 [Thermodesulfobacteriota bacterium]
MNRFQKKKWALLVAVLLSVSAYVSTAAAEYVKAGTHYKLPTQKLPEDVFSKIKANAEKRYPGNDLLRQNTIDTQTRAYFKVIEFANEKIPSQEMIMIKRNAAREYPDDYIRQLVNIDKRAKLYLQQNETTAASKGQP